MLGEGEKKGTFNFLFRYVHGNIREKGIKNFYLNIRSLKFKVLEIKNIIKEHSPHIIGLSECELRKVSTNASDLRIPGYDVLFPRSWDVHGYARVIVYVKKYFHYEQINEQVGLSRATLDPQVNVFHFNLTGLPSQSIQWVNNSTLLKSYGPKGYLLQ